MKDPKEAAADAFAEAVTEELEADRESRERLEACLEAGAFLLLQGRMRPAPAGSPEDDVFRSRVRDEDMWRLVIAPHCWECGLELCCKLLDLDAPAWVFRVGERGDPEAKMLVYVPVPKKVPPLVALARLGYPSALFMDPEDARKWVSRPGWLLWLSRDRDNTTTESLEAEGAMFCDWLDERAGLTETK